MLANEKIHFKHPAKVKGDEGELVVSDVQVLLTSNNGQILVQVPWANVSGVEYAPAKSGLAVFRLKPNVESIGIVAIELIGSSKEKNVSELSQLRGIITTIRSSVPSTAKKAKVSEVSSEQKRQLLLADSALYRKYHDLVEHSKLISEDEFWASHQDALQTQDVEQASKKMKKGDVSIQVAIQEVARNMKQTDDGKFIVDLSEDLKLKIFSRYPMVRRDYDREVPHRQTEASFWYKFFLQQKFRASETKSSSTNATYTSSMTASVHVDTNKVEEEAKKRKRVSVDHDIDLTATFMDYAKKEHFDAGDSSIINNANASVTDMNEESRHAVESSEGNASKKARKVINFDGGDMEPISSYSQHDHMNGHEQDKEGRRQQVAFEQRLMQAGQASATSSSSSSASIDNRQAVYVRLRDTFQQHLILSYNILPTAERANNFFRKVEVGHRLKQAEKGQQHLLSRMNGDTSSQNELREDYAEVAELLLHFHHLLQRMHTQRSGDGKERAVNILTALQRKAQAVDRKRRVWMTASASDEKAEEAVAIANHILQLVQRGEGRWQQTLQEISM